MNNEPQDWKKPGSRSDLKCLALAFAILGVLLLLGMCRAADFSSVLVGRASWYGNEHRGGTMANGQPFNPDRYTIACDALPLGTQVLVRHNGTACVAEVTDRMGRAAKRKHLVADLSESLYWTLADFPRHKDPGQIEVTISK